MNRRTGVSVIGCLWAVGCLSAQSNESKPFDPHMPAPVPEVTGEVKSSAAVHYIDLAIGTGALATPGKQYTVNYNGWLRDGTKFDSTYDRHEPFKFVQGRRMVIAGWELAFEGMRVGGKRRIFIPPQLAYGERGSGTAVPPNAEMIQDVELIEVSDPPPTPVAPPAAADLSFNFDDVATRVLALAKAFPEEKYGWRPGPGVRSFGEVMLHMVAANRLLLNVATNAPSAEALQKEEAEDAASEKQAVSKARIVEMLTESFAAVTKAFGEQRAQGLGREVDLFGQKTSRRAVLGRLDTHLAEHLGQAIAYARVNGITPPWSEGVK